MKEWLKLAFVIPFILAYYYRRQIDLVFNLGLALGVLGFSLFLCKGEYWMLALLYVPLGLFHGRNTVERWKKRYPK